MPDSYISSMGSAFMETGYPATADRDGDRKLARLYDAAELRRYRSQPIERVINLINPVLRGWVNYFAVGHSSECFSFIKDWVEKKVRRQLAHAQKRRASAGNDGVGRGCTTLSGCSTAIECDATGRKSPRQDRSNKPRREANGGAQCGKSARCVRRGGGWKRGTASAYTGAPVLDPTDERGVETGATGDLVRHRQTKGAATDRVDLKPPRHTPTLPRGVLRVGY